LSQADSSFGSAVEEETVDVVKLECFQLNKLFTARKVRGGCLTQV
jgi:hypothetical protein